MKILLLSFYYPPDLCAGSFRASALVDALTSRMGDDDRMDVVTTFPNRYHSFNRESEQHEDLGNVTVYRIRLPAHQSGILDQTKAFVSYFFRTLQYVKGEEYDLVIATSSRLFTAFLGAFICRRKKAPLYLDIRDIFTDTIDSLFTGWKGKMVLPLFRLIERYTLHAADKVNLVSAGFRDHFESFLPNKHFSFFTNGIDDDFLGKDFKKTEVSKKKVVTYAGNIGLGQGLDKIIPQIARATEDDCIFRVIGDGGMRSALESRLHELQVSNVELLAPVDRQRLLALYKESDYLFLHLNDVKAFEKVLPSKIFEYAATGKPILAGVKGFSRLFLEKEVENICLFDPCDADGFISAFRTFSPSSSSRETFIQKYSRKNIMEEMADDILTIPRKSLS